MTKGLRWGELKVNKETAASKWFHVLTERELESLAVWQSEHPSARGCAIAGVDVGQSADRPPSTQSKETTSTTFCCAPTILPGSKLWLCYPKDVQDKDKVIGDERLLTANEALTLQGWPAGWEDLLDRTADTIKFDLAGNAFTSTVALSVFASLMCAIDWFSPTNSDIDEDDDCGQACDIQALLDI